MYPEQARLGIFAQPSTWGHVRRPEAIRRHWDIGVEVGHRPQTDECGCGSQFADLFSGMPATLLTEIKRTIAVVDASLFGNDWIDSRKALLYVGSWAVQRQSQSHASRRLQGTSKACRCHTRVGLERENSRQMQARNAEASRRLASF